MESENKNQYDFDATVLPFLSSDDKHSRMSKLIPLKYHIAESLKALITEGAWDAGTPIPSESELCKQYNVSRTTVLAALQILQSESLIYRRQGKGTYISKSRIERDLSSSETFFGAVNARKKVNSETQILQIKTILADVAVCDLLEIEPNTKIVYLKRLRILESAPIAITWSFLKWEIGKSLLSTPLENNFSIYKYIQEKLYRKPIPSSMKLTLEKVYDTNARLLEVEDGYTCCKTVSTSSINNEVFEVAHTLMNASNFEFVINKINLKE